MEIRKTRYIYVLCQEKFDTELENYCITSKIEYWTFCMSNKNIEIPSGRNFNTTSILSTLFLVQSDQMKLKEMQNSNIKIIQYLKNKRVREETFKEFKRELMNELMSTHEEISNIN
jgi:hypothetical protein